MKPIKLTHLSWGFLTLMILLLTGFGIYLRLELEGVRTFGLEQEAATAVHELEQALANLDRRMQAVANELAQWDETRQHVVDDQYYELWRDGRARDSGIVPKSVRALALYRPTGRIVRADPRGEMPEVIPQVRLPANVYREQGDKPFVYLYFPIKTHPDSPIVLGYGGLKLDLLEALLNNGQLRFVDVARLRVKLADGATLGLSELPKHMEIHARDNKEMADLLRGLQATLIRLGLVMVAVLVFSTWLINHLLVRPLRTLSAEIASLHDHPGQVQESPPPALLPVQEMENLRRSFADYHNRLAELHRNLEQSSRDFYDQARHDALTRVFNRRAFDEDWQALGQDKRVGQCSLILFDCDHFKAINDTYGHPVGDAVVRALAGCLSHALRANDRLYRLGGDEFAALMPGSDIKIASAVAERCLEQVQGHDFTQYGITEPVTISIGLAHSTAPLDLPSLHKQADLAMYNAKRPGNPKIIVYEASLGGLAPLVDNRDVSAVYQAMRQTELLEFRYQPIVCLPVMRAEYAEALCRIRYDGQIIGPGAIFAIVHNRRLDVEFDLAVIAAVSRDLAADLPATRQGVSINLSAPGIVNDKVLAALLALKAAFPERKIVVEITETALIPQMDTATAHIERLREAGCLVALDDFGSGYSSLRYLASMPVDMVKFDMSLVRLLDQTDLRQRLVVEDIAEMVATAGYDLVAEGIETQELLAKVIEVGFSHGQGFYLDRVQVTEVK